MRLKPQIKDFIKQNLKQLAPESRIYLYGSRCRDEARGGDIDILLLTPGKISQQSLRKFRRDFYKRFGWQKIDITNFSFEEEHPFKQYVLEESLEL